MNIKRLIKDKLWFIIIIFKTHFQMPIKVSTPFESHHRSVRNISMIQWSGLLLGKHQSTISFTNTVCSNYFFCVSLNESDGTFTRKQEFHIVTFLTIIDLIPIVLEFLNNYNFLLRKTAAQTPVLNVQVNVCWIMIFLNLLLEIDF